MASLRSTIESLAQEGEDYVIDAPEEWAQGRTLYGGMSAALAYAAVRRAHGDVGPLRSAQFALIGPSTGRLRFRTQVLRQGRSSTVIGADCFNAAGISTRATFVFGAARESVVAHQFVRAPAVPPPDACERFHQTEKKLPGFLGQFEFRLAAGARLFETEKKPEFAVWTRFADPDEGDPVTALLAIADALPCAAMANFPKPAPLSTMTWSVDVKQPLAAHTPWRLITSSSESAADGYSLQAMQVFNEAGELLALARQVVAIFA